MESYIRPYSWFVMVLLNFRSWFEFAGIIILDLSLLHHPAFFGPFLQGSLWEGKMSSQCEKRWNRRIKAHPILDCRLKRKLLLTHSSCSGRFRRINLAASSVASAVKSAHSRKWVFLSCITFLVSTLQQVAPFDALNASCSWRALLRKSWRLR